VQLILAARRRLASVETAYSTVVFAELSATSSVVVATVVVVQLQLQAAVQLLQAAVASLEPMIA
jgi:hypothetical protein